MKRVISKRNRAHKTPASTKVVYLRQSRSGDKVLTRATKPKPRASAVDWAPEEGLEAVRAQTRQPGMCELEECRSGEPAKWNMTRIRTDLTIGVCHQCLQALMVIPGGRLPAGYSELLQEHYGEPGSRREAEL